MKLTRILSLPFLPFKTYYYWRKAENAFFPGKYFAEYGFNIGFKLLRRGKISFKLLFNPVSIVRYFEFDFVNSNLNFENKQAILDISSPYLFGFYMCKNKDVSYTYINPDKRDLNNVQSLADKLDFRGNYNTACVDARSLTYAECTFDVVLSISVIEHVHNGDDSSVMKELWRVLKPGGELILTFPVKGVYEEEFRDDDIYKLDGVKREKGYFFQRIYDEENIIKRLLSSISDFEIIDKKIFGETSSDFYDEYKKRWIKNGYSETVKDAYYISKNFRYFNSISELKGIGVMGLTLKKVK